MPKKCDLTDRHFGRLKALHPTERRDKKGSIFWKCRCECGNEVEVTQDALVYGHYRSCGCLREEHCAHVADALHHVDGTCVEWLEKRKSRRDNVSGFRGVFKAGERKYRVSIGFKRQRFYLGTYQTYEEAVAARLEAEVRMHDGFLRAYRKWQESGGRDAQGNAAPLIFDVEKQGGGFVIRTNMQ